MSINYIRINIFRFCIFFFNFFRVLVFWLLLIKIKKYVDFGDEVNFYYKIIKINLNIIELVLITILYDNVLYVIVK